MATHGPYTRKQFQDALESLVADGSIAKVGDRYFAPGFPMEAPGGIDVSALPHRFRLRGIPS